MIEIHQHKIILQLFKKAKKISPEFLISWSEKLVSELLVEKSSYAFTVKSASGQYISALLFTGHPHKKESFSLSEIQLIFTDPDFSAKGHASELLNKLKTCSQEVWLDVHPKNKKAISLYLSMGFKEVGRRKNYYFDGSEAILMSYQK